MPRSDESHAAALRKAALFVSSLDESTAQTLLEQLAPHEREQLQWTIATLDEIAESERNEVVQQFLTEGAGRRRTATPLDADEVALSPIAALEPGRDAGRTRRATNSSPLINPVNPSASESVSFRALIDNVPVRMLVEVLRDEHPQTIAVVLTRVSSRQAASLLGELETPLQLEVARRIAELGPADAEVLADIEHEIVEHLAMRAEQLSDELAGSNTLQAILTAADRECRSELLQNIATQDVKLAARLGLVSGQPPTEMEATEAYLPRFDDLVMLDDFRLASLFRHADVELTAIALSATDDTLTRRVLSLLPVMTARKITDRMATLAPIRLSDIDRAQQEMMRLAHDQQLV